MNATSNVSNGTAAHIQAAGATVALSDVKVGDQSTFTAKVAFTDNDREILTKALTSVYNVCGAMGPSQIAADFLTNADTLGELLGRAHRVWKEDAAARRKAAREVFAVKVNEHITSLLAKREKALKAYMSLDADIRADLPTPSSSIAVWISDLLSLLPKGYDEAKAAKALHDMGYMVHVAKIDGRRKDKPTPPYLTATVGQPIRTSAAVKDGASK